MLSTGLIERIWYTRHLLQYALLPLSWCYRLFIILRRFCYQIGIIAVNKVDAPVIIVGNINIGGTGKTPLVIWLADYFKQQGFTPGIVSRGYGGSASHNPQQVRPDSNPALVGDEPVLIAKNTRCSVAVALQRRQAAEELIRYCKCDLIICDDGMQHYSLDRDLEIAVIDGHRRFGNGHCLPAGPLREPISRLDNVDLIVSKHAANRHEFKMDYVYGNLTSVIEPTKTQAVTALTSQQVHAIAGIGNPVRFFSYLRNQGLQIIKHQFPDHYIYTKEDICFNDNLSVVMTEKDAVKCLDIATEHHWYLPIKASLSRAFTYRLDTLIKEITNGQKTT